ncbi:NADP-dependent glyceraldehyde-3-phosphate dehydrogenase [Durusdinium trenchii]|uniref:NADP-dependent glyceraldehyde-3-phosphate dehydrogenase n=1 Tax=Durusdinium trenchii TaxID=1381693 RepID=A0ABP0IXW2_9DINO
MTNYSKWDKFAADLASDTEEEEERELEKYTSKTACFIHVPPGDFTKKEQLCKLLEEDPDFEAPSSTAAGIVTEDAEPEPGVSRALKKYKWQSVTSSFIPGYAPGGGSDDLWRLFFDDNFLTTQTEPNRAARALLGYKSLGSFVVSCVSRTTGVERPISRKEVADLIMRRQHGGDAERISREHEDQKARMDAFSKLGGQTVELSG